MVKSLPAIQETWVRSCVWKVPWRRKWQPTPVFLPGKSYGRRSWQATAHWVAKSWTRLSDFTHSLIVYYQEKVLINEKSLKAGNRFSVQNTEFPWGNILEYRHQYSMSYTVCLVSIDYITEGSGTAVADTHISSRPGRTCLSVQGSKLRWQTWPLFTMDYHDLLVVI